MKAQVHKKVQVQVKVHVHIKVQVDIYIHMKVHVNIKIHVQAKVELVNGEGAIGRNYGVKTEESIDTIGWGLDRRGSWLFVGHRARAEHDFVSFRLQNSSSLSQAPGLAELWCPEMVCSKAY